MAEAAMKALAPSEGRQRAHNLVAQALRNHPKGLIAGALRLSVLSVAPQALLAEKYLGSVAYQIDEAIAAFEHQAQSGAPLTPRSGADH